MVRSGDLNEPLEKLLDLRRRDEPDRLPRLVSFPELARIEVRDTAEQMSREVRFAQSFALVPRRRISQIAVVKSEVVPVPPMSLVLCSGPSPRSLMIAL